MFVGELAGLLAAIVLCALVVLATVPLIETSRVLDRVRAVVRDLGYNSVPVLVGLRNIVENTNAELKKLSLVTNNVVRISGRITMISEYAADLSQLFVATLGGLLVRDAVVAHDLRTALKKCKK